jgi:hypothetical protein
MLFLFIESKFTHFVYYQALDVIELVRIYNNIKKETRAYLEFKKNINLNLNN